VKISHMNTELQPSSISRGEAQSSAKSLSRLRSFLGRDLLDLHLNLLL
jgi:hypothetical protein